MQGGQSPCRFLDVMRELWGSITTEEQTEICRRMAVDGYSFYNPYIFSFLLRSFGRDLINLKLPLLCISWALFALLLSRVHQVRSFVSRQKSPQAMQPCRQHLLLNKLLIAQI